MARKKFPSMKELNKLDVDQLTQEQKEHRRAENRRLRRERRSRMQSMGIIEWKQCKATTSKNKRCPQGRAYVEIDGKMYRAMTCFAHLPDKVRQRAGLAPWGGAHGASGQRRKPHPTDVLRELFEAELAEWLLPYREALNATKPVVTGSGRHAKVTMVPDWRVRIEAAEAVWNRVYGKPKTVTELTGQDGKPVEIEFPKDKDRAVEVAKILAESGALPGSELTKAVAEVAGRQN